MPPAIDDPPPPALHPEESVLVVDDDERMRSLIRAALARQYGVFCAASAAEAEAILAEHPVRVVLCDHFMPGETGLEFLSRLRTSHPRLQRILLTGYARTDMLLDAINKSGVRSYLVKPVDVARLRETVRQAMADYAEACRLRQMETENVQLHAGLREVEEAGERRLALGGRLLALSLLGIVGVMLAALVLGMFVFVVLYFLKSGLGIDLIPEHHFWFTGS